MFCLRAWLVLTTGLGGLDREANYQCRYMSMDHSMYGCSVYLFSLVYVVRDIDIAFKRYLAPLITVAGRPLLWRRIGDLLVGCSRQAQSLMLDVRGWVMIEIRLTTCTV